MSRQKANKAVEESTANTEKKTGSYIVLTPFKSKDGVVYVQGDDVSHLSLERLEKLISRNAVEKK